MVNSELKALAAAGADYLQLDAPSYAIIPGSAPGSAKDWVDLFNAAVDGVPGKIALHVCFGNLASRPRGKRTYRWMFPELQRARCHQFIFEYANREMSEIDLWCEVGVDREIGVGVVDVKSFYQETPEDVAERIRLALQHIPADKLWLNPDCGFFPVPRWLCAAKLKALVAGARLVRRELAG